MLKALLPENLGQLNNLNIGLEHLFVAVLSDFDCF